MNTIIEELIEYGLSHFKGERVEDVRVGLGYTAVKLDTAQAGVACMLRHRLDNAACCPMANAGSIAGSPADRVIPLLRSPNIAETSVGLAVLNALIQQDGYEEDSSNDDLVQLLDITSNDRVGMVGDITPIFNRIQKHAKECIVFDEGKSDWEGIADTSLEKDMLPRCDVALLSATTLLNNTFESVLSMVAGAREICVIGPSAPLLPDVFKKRGVTLLSGRRFLDADRLLRIVSEAGGTKCFGPISLKVNIRLK